jgi:hypothetical protein
VQGAGDPQLLAVTLVSREFFAAMQVRPDRGPGFAESDQQVGAAPVALVSAALWARMGDRPQPAGERLTVGSRTVTVWASCRKTSTIPVAQRSGCPWTTLRGTPTAPDTTTRRLRACATA